LLEIQATDGSEECRADGNGFHTCYVLAGQPKALVVELSSG